MTDVTYAREQLGAPEAELEELVRRYYEPTQAHEGIPPYRFNWPLYWRAENASSLLLVTARRDRKPWGAVSGAAHYTGKLVGWALYLILDHPHHRGLCVADCDTLAVDHLERGKGIGRGLVEFSEPILRERHGATRIIHRHRLVYGDNALFPKLGFRPVEVAYSKDI